MPIVSVSETKTALGGPVTLSVTADDTTTPTKAIFAQLWKTVYVFERRFSRFIPQSELSAFNRQSGLRVSISPDFRELLLAAQRMATKTAGLYNPFILPALQRAGYVQSAAPGYESDTQEDYSNRQVVSADHLVIHEDWSSIPYGTAIDLGGCGKGYLADCLANIVKTHNIRGYWFSLSGDIVSGGLDENNHPIRVAIQDASNLSLTTDWVVDCPKNTSAVATSGSFQRPNHPVQKRWHHIIDPATLMPAQSDVLLATVCAQSGLEADVLASCAVMIGSEKALHFLRHHGASSALLQYRLPDGTISVRHFGQLISREPSTQKTKQELHHA